MTHSPAELPGQCPGLVLFTRRHLIQTSPSQRGPSDFKKPNLGLDSTSNQRSGDLSHSAGVAPDRLILWGQSLMQTGENDETSHASQDPGRGGACASPKAFLILPLLPTTWDQRLRPPLFGPFPNVPFLLGASVAVALSHLLCVLEPFIHVCTKPQLL